MIYKLLVLNGTEGHKFEVGKQYVDSGETQTVEKILINGNGGYKVWFVGDEWVDVITENVLVYSKL